MISLFAFICIVAMPFLGIVFCLNLVNIIRKIKNDKETKINTFFLTLSFVLIIWSISVMIIE